MHGLITQFFNFLIFIYLFSCVSYIQPYGNITEHIYMKINIATKLRVGKASCLAMRMSTWRYTHALLGTQIFFTAQGSLVEVRYTATLESLMYSHVAEEADKIDYLVEQL